MKARLSFALAIRSGSPDFMAASYSILASISGFCASISCCVRFISSDSRSRAMPISATEAQSRVKANMSDFSSPYSVLIVLNIASPAAASVCMSCKA